MNKMLKNIFTVLSGVLFTTLILTGCQDLSVSDDSAEKMGYLYVSSLEGVEGCGGESTSRGTEQTGDSTILDTALIKADVYKIVIQSNAKDVLGETAGAKYETIGTWTSEVDATEEAENAVIRLQNDKSISIPEGTYKFDIYLYDKELNLLGSGTTAGVTVHAYKEGVYDGFNALSFTITQAENGKGAFRIKNSFASDAGVTRIEAGVFYISTETIEIKNPADSSGSSGSDADIDDDDDNESSDSSDDSEEEEGDDSSSALKDKPVELSDTVKLDYENLTIVKGDGTNYAYYKAAAIPAGSYIYKVNLYGMQGESEVFLNSYSYVVQIAVGSTTYSDSLTLSNINVIYSIKYNLNGGVWATSYSPVYYRNNSSTTILPTSAGIVKSGYSFVGWYKSEALDGDAVTQIEAGTCAEDKEYWAKWIANTLSYSVTLHQSEAARFALTGNLVSDTSYIVEAPAGYDTYKWFVNNEHKAEYDNKQVVTLNIREYAGGHHEITLHVSKDGKNYSEEVNFSVTKLPDFPITYKNGTYIDFITGDFTGVHEENYAEKFYYSGTTILDVPSMEYYDFGGYYISPECNTTEINVISGTDFDDEITLYAKWIPKNPLKVTLPENSIKNFEDKKLMTSGSDIYVLGSNDGTKKWYTYQFFSKNENNLSADLRSSLHRTSAAVSFLPVSVISSNIDNDLDDDVIILDYTDQKQTNTVNTLAAHDFMAGKIKGTDLESELVYKPLSERLDFALSGVPTDKTFTKMVLYIPDTYIPLKGKTIMEENPVFTNTEVVPADKYNHFEMELELTSGDGNLTISTMLPQFDCIENNSPNGKTLILTLIDSENNYYNAYFEGQDYKAGNIYNYSAEVSALPHFVTMGGKNIATHNLGAYSPEDYGTMHAYGKDSTGAAEVDFDGQFGSGSKVPSFDDWNAIAAGSGITAVYTISHGVSGIQFTSGDVKFFVPGNGYSKVSYEAGNSTRNGEVNLWTNTKAGDTNYAYTLYASSEEDENGVMAYSDSSTYMYGYRPFKE